jgi:uncharacterized protein YcbK (DUF882 family)
MRNRAIFLVILLASLTATTGRVAHASSAPTRPTQADAEPLLAASESNLLLPAPTASPWVEAVREIVARLLLEATLPQPAQTAVATIVPVDLFDVNGEKSAHFELPLDGQLSPELNLEVAKFFSCRRSGKVRPIHPNTLAMLAEVAQRYPGHTIEIVSGYRASREERKTSPHLAGRAIDLRVRGVKTTDVRDWLWSTHSHVGIGFYPHHDYLHMDTRPEQKDTAWTQARLNADNDYHPRWARKARETAHKLQERLEKRREDHVASR